MYFVDLPGSVELGITALLLAGFNALIVYVIARVPMMSFLERYKGEWGAALSVAFIGWLEGVLPAAHPDTVILAVQLVLSVIAALGFVKKFLGGFGVTGFRA